MSNFCTAQFFKQTSKNIRNGYFGNSNHVQLHFWEMDKRTTGRHGPIFTTFTFLSLLRSHVWAKTPYSRSWSPSEAMCAAVIRKMCGIRLVTSRVILLTCGTPYLCSSPLNWEVTGWRCQMQENERGTSWVSMRRSFTKCLLCVQLLGHQGFVIAANITLPQLILGELELEDRCAPNPNSSAMFMWSQMNSVIRSLRVSWRLWHLKPDLMRN